MFAKYIPLGMYRFYYQTINYSNVLVADRLYSDVTVETRFLRTNIKASLYTQIITFEIRWQFCGNIDKTRHRGTDTSLFQRGVRYRSRLPGQLYP